MNDYQKTFRSLFFDIATIIKYLETLILHITFEVLFVHVFTIPYCCFFVSCPLNHVYVPCVHDVFYDFRYVLHV